jgi:hypothetical protein
MKDEVSLFWWAIIGVLKRRELLEEQLRPGAVLVPEADAYVLPDRVVFVLDVERLGGIPRAVWLDRRVWAEWREALGGRRVFTSEGEGLAITVSRTARSGEAALPDAVG